ncbi:cell division ATP-binding protein FtsE [Rhodanobacter koreensis]
MVRSPHLGIGFPYPCSWYDATQVRGYAVIHFDQVSKRYEGGHEALSQLSFEVPTGEMAFVTGHSGAGKSTLLKLLGLIERPSHGTISMDGKNLSRIRRSGIPKWRRQIGMVFQDHRLLMERTVFANVELPLVIGGIARPERARRVRAALEKVGLLAYERQLPDTLSAGEQQRVGIARAIVARPSLLIADEPTGNLDPQLAVEIMGLFGEFQQVGTTVLIASHDLPLIKRMKKRVIVLDHGRLVADLAAQEVL